MTKSNNLECSGQASLEYLLVLAAFLGILLALAPYFHLALELALFSQDVQEMQRVAGRVEHNARLLHALGNDSQLPVTMHTNHRVELSASGSSVQLTLFSPSLEKEHRIERAIPLPVHDTMVHTEGTTSFLMRKENGALLFIYR